MQNNQEQNSNNNEHWKEIFARDWKKDFASMTQDEIHMNIQNMFWQMFMIQLEYIKINSSVDVSGHSVSITLTGEVYRDPEGLPNYLMAPEYYEEFNEEDED